MLLWLLRRPGWGGSKCHLCVTSSCAQPLDREFNKRCSCARFMRLKDQGAGKLRVLMKVSLKKWIIKSEDDVTAGRMVVGGAMGIPPEPKTCLLPASQDLWLHLSWRQHVATEGRRFTEWRFSRGRQDGRESRPVPRGKTTTGKTFSNLCPRHLWELYLTHSRGLRVTRISVSQWMRTAQDTAGCWQTTKLTTIMIRIICERVWTNPRSCHKYLMKGHFKRLLAEVAH